MIGEEVSEVVEIREIKVSRESAGKNGKLRESRGNDVN